MRNNNKQMRCTAVTDDNTPSDDIHTVKNSQAKVKYISGAQMCEYIFIIYYLILS